MKSLLMLFAIEKNEYRVVYSISLRPSKENPMTSAQSLTLIHW